MNNINIIFVMKWLLVLMGVFYLTRSEIIYSMYNISCVPPLEKLCGLCRAQITAAQKSTCNDGDDSSSSESRKQSMDVLASCAEDKCLDRQRELVECLMYEAIAAEGLNAQLVLDVQSLTFQLGSATASRERSTVVLFDKINQLDTAFNEYRAAASEADVTAHKHAEQQNVVREARACTERIRSQLVEAKAELTAAINCNVGSGVGPAQRNFGLYASGCRPGEHEKTTTCSTSCATTVSTTCKTKTTP